MKVQKEKARINDPHPHGTHSQPQKSWIENLCSVFPRMQFSIDPLVCERIKISWQDLEGEAKSPLPPKEYIQDFILLLLFIQQKYAAAKLLYVSDFVNCTLCCCNWEIVVFTFVEPQTINNFASLDQDTINDFNLYLLAQVKTSCPDKKKLAKWNGVKCGKVSFPFSGFFLPGLTSIYDLLPVRK